MFINKQDFGVTQSPRYPGPIIKSTKLTILPLVLLLEIINYLTTLEFTQIGKVSRGLSKLNEIRWVRSSIRLKEIVSYCASLTINIKKAEDRKKKEKALTMEFLSQIRGCENLEIFPIREVPMFQFIENMQVIFSNTRTPFNKLKILQLHLPSCDIDEDSDYPDDLMGDILKVCPRIEQLLLLNFSSLSCLPLLRGCMQLKRVTLNDQINVKIVRCLNSLPKLVSIFLISSNIKRYMKLLPLITHLEGIEIYKYNNSVGSDLIPILPHCRKLKKLSIHDLNGSDHILSSLLRKLKNITELNLITCFGITGDIFYAIDHYKHLRKLTVSDWIEFEFPINSVNFQSIKACHLSVLRNCPYLTEISITNCESLGENEWELITSIPQLQRLTMIDDGVDASRANIWASHLAFLRNCTVLSYLKINVKVTQKAYWPSEITTTNLLEAISHCKSLRELDLSAMEYQKLDIALIEQFQQLRPKLVIHLPKIPPHREDSPTQPASCCLVC